MFFFFVAKNRNHLINQ